MSDFWSNLNGVTEICPPTSNDFPLSWGSYVLNPPPFGFGLEGEENDTAWASDLDYDEFSMPAYMLSIPAYDNPIDAGDRPASQVAVCVENRTLWYLEQNYILGLFFLETDGEPMDSWEYSLSSTTHPGTMSMIIPGVQITEAPPGSIVEVTFRLPEGAGPRDGRVDITVTATRGDVVKSATLAVGFTQIAG